MRIVLAIFLVIGLFILSFINFELGYKTGLDDAKEMLDKAIKEYEKQREDEDLH